MPRRIAVLIASAVGAVVLMACDGSDDRPLLETAGTASPAATDSGTRGAGTGTQPTATPEVPTPSSDGPTRVSASINGSCRLTEGGSEITVNYRVRVEGSGRLTALRFLVNGVVTEETGATNERDIQRSATIKVPDGTSHAFQVVAESGNSRSSSSTTVRCPAPTPGPTL